MTLTIRRYLHLLLIVFLLGALSRTAHAEVTDDCTTAENDDWHTYRNLGTSQNSTTTDFDWLVAPDRTALAVLVPGTDATALYAIEGAQGLEVALYSLYSTFATPISGGWMQGFPAGGSIAQARRLSLGASGRLYLNASGWHTLTRDKYGDIQFLPLTSSPNEGILSYGLTVFCSPDGKSFSPTPAVLRTARNALTDRPGMICYYESYSVSVPVGTEVIRIELRETASFFLTGGGSVGNATRGSLRLASARFTGNAVRGSLFGSPSSSSLPTSSSLPAPSSSIPSPSSDPDLQPPSESSSTPSVGSSIASSSKSSSSKSSSSKRPSSSSRKSASSNTLSSASSKKSSASTSPRESTRGGGGTALPEAYEHSAAPLPKEGIAAPVAEDAPSPSTAAQPQRNAPRDSESTRTLLFGGGYLVLASASLFFFLRKK